MNWKFWEKDKSTATSGGVGEKANPQKLSKPKSLPPQIGQHLVAQLKQDPDWVWSLKYVSRSRPDSKYISDFRVFNDFQARDAKVSVKSYASLDDNRGLILFEGWFNKSTNKYLVNDTRIKEAEKKAAA